MGVVGVQRKRGDLCGGGGALHGVSTAREDEEVALRASLNAWRVPPRARDEYTRESKGGGCSDCYHHRCLLCARCVCAVEQQRAGVKRHPPGQA